MHSFMFPFFVIFWIFAVLWSAPATLAQDFQNLIEDPSFEGKPAGEGLPAGWTEWHAGDSQYKISVAEEGQTGKRSIRISGKGERAYVNAPRIAISDKDRFLLWGYARIEGSENAFATVQLTYWEKKDGNWVASTSSHEIYAKDKGWQVLATISELDKYPQAGLLNVVLVLNGEGTALFDNLTLVKLLPGEEGNLVPNGDMEVWVQDQLVSWHKNSPKEGEIVFSKGDEKPKDGALCLRMTGRSPWASANSPVFRIEKTKTYNATAFVKVRKGEAHLQIGYFNEGQWLGSSDTASVSPGEWTRLSLDAELSKYQGTNKLNVAIIGSDEFDVLIDDVVLVETAAK